METENAAARVAADDLVVRTVQQHADSLLRLARRHSLCTDDAYDAYQRGLEIFLKHAPRLEPATAHQWLHTVVKRKTSIGRVRPTRLPTNWGCATVGAYQYSSGSGPGTLGS